MSSTKLQLQNPGENLTEKIKGKLPESVTDVDGKVYELRIPDPIDEFDLSAGLGREHSTNLGVLMQAMPLLYIQSINGKVFNFSASFTGIRAALKEVGRNGMKVVNKAVQEFIQAEQNEQEDVDSLKK